MPASLLSIENAILKLIKKKSKRVHYYVLITLRSKSKSGIYYNNSFRSNAGFSYLLAASVTLVINIAIVVFINSELRVVFRIVVPKVRVYFADFDKISHSDSNIFRQADSFI